MNRRSFLSCCSGLCFLSPRASQSIAASGSGDRSHIVACSGFNSSAFSELDDSQNTKLLDRVPSYFTDAIAESARIIGHPSISREKINIEFALMEGMKAGSDLTLYIPPNAFENDDFYFNLTTLFHEMAHFYQFVRYGDECDVIDQYSPYESSFFVVEPEPILPTGNSCSPTKNNLRKVELIADYMCGFLVRKIFRKNNVSNFFRNALADQGNVLNPTTHGASHQRARMFQMGYVRAARFGNSSTFEENYTEFLNITFGK